MGGWSLLYCLDCLAKAFLPGSPIILLNSKSLRVESISLHLREATIHKQFRSRDVTAVFGG
jgi:hypothetical protein